jgi:hypothetical protein
MKIQLYSVFDDKLGEFNTPMAFQSRGVAIRSFSDEVKRDEPGNMLFRHPGDYSLYYVGELDTGSASFRDSAAPAELIIRGSDCSSL